MLREPDAPADVVLEAGDVPLVHGTVCADVFVPESTAEVVGVAATDFADDVERVTGERPTVAGDPTAATDALVVAGVAGESTVVDRCLAASDAETGDFADGVPLTDCRESTVVATIGDPPAPVEAEHCLLVAGSDRRGAAYGLYELSERMGVSPWYWWADVPPADRESVVVAAGTYTLGPPDVTYRGIFLNDEDFGLRPWAAECFGGADDGDTDGPAAIGPETYERVFELLLRLRANAMWPAMHPGTKAFFRTPEHAALADRYAIVVGTSHCEPLHRNNVDEWTEELGEWNYATNAERIREYWRERVESVADAENLFTVGMRGIHDSGMPGAETLDERVELLQSVLDDQRDILADTHDVPAEAVPQVLCPYKEVLELLRGGLDVPEDVCLVWPDDSHGYMRELPTASERDRAGGSGVYYHLSYWGRPHDYLWLSSVPLGLVRHQLRTAAAAGATECWIVNVGDIKPAEKEMEFFLDLAWDLEGDAAGPTRAWLEDWARREFGGAAPVDVDDGESEFRADDLAAEVADVLLEYYRLCQARKPEHMGWSTVYPDTQPDEPPYSAVAAGDEARRRVDSFAAIAERATAIRDTLPAASRPAFYELVVYPVRAAALMTETYLHAARSRLYAGQGRATADAYADQARDAHEAIRTETEYYNEDLLDGKWQGMLSASPRDLPVFDEPSTATVDPHDGPALGVAVEGRRRPVGRHEEPPPVLPRFDPVTDREHFVDVFARGTEPVEWAVETSAAWIETDETSGTVTDERRLWVGVDWDRLPADSADDGPIRGELVVSAPGVEKTVGVEAVPRDASDADFVVSNGCAAIEAEHYSRVVDGGVCDGGGNGGVDDGGDDRLRWERTDVPGRVSGATMAVRPHAFESRDAVADAPRLSYDVDLSATAGADTAGRDVVVEVHCTPTQSLTADHDLRYAVGFEGIDADAGGGADGGAGGGADGGAGGGADAGVRVDPRVVSVDVDGGEHDPEWQRNVLRGAAVGRSTHAVEPSGSGTATLSLWALDPGLVVDRIVVWTASRRASEGRETYLGPRETAVGR